MTVLVMSIGPALLILTYIYFRDKYEKEPILLLVRGFAAGALILFPILLIELQAGKLSLFFPTILKAAWDGFIVASATEEIIKFLAVYYLFWNNRNFNEKFDGIIYSVAVSLGFAAVENFFYIYQGTLGTGLLRAFTAVPAHAIFGIVMGYYLGMARFRPFRKTGYLFMAIFMPWIFHGLYDFLLLSGHRVLGSLFIPLMIILVVMGFRRMKEHSDASVFSINLNKLTGMNLWHKLKPGVPRQVLVLLGAALWGFAAFRILKLGYIKIDSSALNSWINYTIGVLGFIPFYWFVFRKVIKRYILRIINLESDRPCVFAFFDIRGYVLMSLMISMGILISHWSVIPDLYTGTFFVSLGLSLLASAIYYIYAGFRYYILFKLP